MQIVTLINRLRRLFSARDKLKIVSLAAAMGVNALAELAGIGLLLPVAAVFIDPELLKKFRWLEEVQRCCGISDNRSMILIGVALVLAVFFCKNLFAFYVIHLQSAFTAGKLYELSVRLERAYINAPYETISSRSRGDFNTSAVRVFNVCSCVLQPLLLIGADMLVLAALLGFLCFFMPWTTLGGGLFILLSGGAVYMVFRRMNGHLGQQYADSDAGAKRVLLETMQNIKYIKASGSEKFFTEKYSVRQKNASWSFGRLYLWGQMPRLALDFAALLLVMGVFAFMLLRGLSGSEIMLSFAMLLAVTARLLPALSRLHYNCTILRQWSVMFDEVYNDIMELEAAARQAAERNSVLRSPVVKLTHEKNLQVKNLHFSYPGGEDLFNGLSFELPHGGSLAVTGRTGRGKSTLADLILGLLEPENGEILSDSCNIAANPASWRLAAAYVPQEICLLDDTVRRNVAFAVDEPDIDDARVRQALCDAQLGEYASKTDYRIGENGIALSGGQRQRLAIARALYRGASLIVLDEATSALDDATEKALAQTLAELKGKVTLIIIAHRPYIVERCDMVLPLDNIQ